jgi:PadR family transcriptional regulator PadR
MSKAFCCAHNRSPANNSKSSKDRYTALYRLDHQGWIVSEWGEPDNKRKAKFYSLSADGRRQLRPETEKWKRMASLIAGILRTAPEEI